MSLNGDHYKEFQEQNFILQDEEKGVICKVTCEKQRLGENYKLKSNAKVNDLQDGKGEAVQLWDVIPERRLQPQESMVCRERFLHLRSLKVLLVENDDSTRHIVSALLRNCNYEVIEAANGLQAWKILEDLSNHIDLILTEVVMPCFSGIGLLCKIMNHKTRNNIPVIMMSSHDSMGLVFKCLSKGAVDFLVKPVRKNELKILWQHVWRRSHTMDNSVFSAPNEHLKISDIMSKAASDSDEPAPELSLKRLRGAADYQNATRRSESTSFSRYNAASNFNQALTVQVESSSPCEISPDIQSNSSRNPPNQSLNGDSNNVDMGSITNNAFTKSNMMSKFSVVAPTVHGLQVSPQSKSMKEDKTSTPEQILLDNCDDMATAIMQAQPKDIKSLCDSHVRHLLHQQTLPSEHGDLSLKKMAVTLTHCRSSNLDGPIEGSASNFSVERSGSGGNPDSNGQNGEIGPKRKERCTRKEVHYQNHRRP